MAYRKTDHPGVSVYRRKGHGLYAKWRNPHTLGMEYQSLGALGYTTKKAAADWLRDKTKEIRGDKQKASRDGRSVGIGDDWGTIEERYLEHYTAEHGKDAAERTKRDWLKHWRGFTASRAIGTGGQLTSRLLAAFRDSLASNKTKLAPATRNRVLGATGAFLKWSSKNGYIRLSRDQITDTLLPYKLDRRQPRVLSKSELKALLRALRRHDRARHYASRTDKRAYTNRKSRKSGSRVYEPLGAFALVALLTGARPGEVLAMKWEDVDFERKEIRIWGSKTRAERTVPLHDSTLLEQVLEHLNKKRGTNVHVCGDWARGKSIEIHDRQWRRLTTMAGLKNAPMKVLRSTCVAHVASASPDSEYLLESRFGHGAAVSKRHYRRPLHGLSARGTTVEEWLGLPAYLCATARILGLIPRKLLQSDPAAARRRG